MKTEKDKLIDFANFTIKKIEIVRNGIKTVDEFVDYYLKSINPRNETDGHRRLEDNKGEDKICTICGSRMSIVMAADLWVCNNKGCDGVSCIN